MFNHTLKYCLYQDEHLNISNIVGELKVSESYQCKLRIIDQQEAFLDSVKSPYKNLEQHQKGVRTITRIKRIYQNINNIQRPQKILKENQHLLTTQEESLSIINPFTTASAIVKTMMENKLTKNFQKTYYTPNTWLQKRKRKKLINTTPQKGNSPYVDGWQQNVLQKYYLAKTYNSAQLDSHRLSSSSITSRDKSCFRQKKYTSREKSENNATNRLLKDSKYDFSDIEEEFKKIVIDKHNKNQSKGFSVRNRSLIQDQSTQVTQQQINKNSRVKYEFQQQIIEPFNLGLQISDQIDFAEPLE